MREFFYLGFCVFDECVDICCVIESIEYDSGFLVNKYLMFMY